VDTLSCNALVKSDLVVGLSLLMEFVILTSTFVAVVCDLALYRTKTALQVSTAKIRTLFVGLTLGNAVFLDLLNLFVGPILVR
jgi:hypothetical protein